MLHLILSLAAKVLCCTLWGRRINRGIVRSWDKGALQSCWINHSAMVVIHSLIQPVMTFVTSQLHELHPVSHSPSHTVTVGAWFTGVTGENAPDGTVLSCLRSCDCNSEKYKDRKWNESRAGDWLSEGKASRRDSSVWETEMCCTGFSLTSFTSCHLTSRKPLENLNLFETQPQKD